MIKNHIREKLNRLPAEVSRNATSVSFMIVLT
jgi:hypothetical protein